MGKAKVFYNMMLLGTKAFDEVPDKYKDQVSALGKADVASGKLWPSDYEELFGEPYTP